MCNKFFLSDMPLFCLSCCFKMKFIFFIWKKHFYVSFNHLSDISINLFVGPLSPTNKLTSQESWSSTGSYSSSYGKQSPLNLTGKSNSRSPNTPSRSDSPWTIHARHSPQIQRPSQSGFCQPIEKNSPEINSPKVKADEFAWQTVKSSKNVQRGGNRGGHGYRRSTSDQLHNRGETGHFRGNRRVSSEGGRWHDRRRSSGQNDRSARGRKA